MKIKVVYNWIGPAGPTDNNYLPNVLSFAQAFDENNHIPPQWNADWTWQQFFSHGNDHFEICPSIAISENDDSLFVFPVALSWRNIIPTYYSKNLGILEASRIPANVLNCIKHHNGYFVIDFSGEGHGIRDVDFDHMHSYFTHLKIPLSKIIYITGSSNSTDLYAKYCSNRGVSAANRMNLVPYIRGTVHVVSKSISEPNYDSEIVPEKLFLSWNKRTRKHRFDIALLLEKHDLVGRSYLSFHKNDEETGIGFKETYRNIGGTTDSTLDITPEIIDSFVSKLPLVLDGETNLYKILFTNLEVTTRPFYQNSLISLITETHFYEEHTCLTEKSFKQAKEKHPFIIVGGAGSLKYLRELGFKTFSDFWDESYDDCKDPVERMQRIDSLIKNIGEWTPEQLLDFRRKVKPIVEHNFKVFDTEMVKNALRLSLSKINDIVTAA